MFYRSNGLVLARGHRSGQRSGLKRLTALLTLVAFVTPIVTPALAAAQPSGEPLEQVSASDWAQPSRTFDVLPTIQPDVGVPAADGATRDPNLHAPDDTPDATLGPVSAEHGKDHYDVSSSDTLDGIAAQGSGSGASGATPDPVETTALPSGADKSGVTSKAISMPKGSGTIDGMGESFSAQLSTGIATFSVPFALPAARGGAQPSLGLSYSSSGGFLAAGVGWSLGVPFIARQTDRGLPGYVDQADWYENQDRFVFNGGQELVPICLVTDAGCDKALPLEEMPPWAEGHQYFRARVEGSFLRFFWSPDHLTWRVQDKSGVTMELGVPLDGSADRTALEVNPDNDVEIFRWNLVRQYDTHGDANPESSSAMPAPYNAVVYKYFQDGETAYLSDIFDTSPADEPTSADLSKYAHHTRVRWDPRPDRTESYRSGWRMQQRLRVAGVDVTSKTFNQATSPRRVVRRYHLAYDPDSNASLLESVQVEGRCEAQEEYAESEDGTGKLPDDTGCERLPPMTFGYERVQGSATLPGYEAVNEELIEVENAPDHSIDEALTDFFDINSDSLADILVTAPGLYNDGHAFFQNGAGGVVNRFGGPTEIGIKGVLGANANTIRLTNLNVVPLDVDGDGHINLLHMPRVKTYSLYSPERVGNDWLWKGRVIEAASGQDPKIDFGNDTLDTEVADVDFDGLVDVVVSSGTEFQTFFSLGRYPNGDGQFGSAEFVSATTSRISNDPVTTCVPWAGSPVRFSDGDTHLADMNGDGIVDIARVHRGDIRYWPGRGNGFWGTGQRDDCPAGGFGADRYVEMADSPYYSDIQGTTLRLDDVNGDGLTDLVQVRFDEVDIFLNVNGEGWTDRHIIPNTPASPSYANRVRLVDINGSGTRDIVWGTAENYRYIDLAGGRRPWVLTHVDNGLGKTTELEYSTSAHEMLTAEQNGECSSALRGQASEHGPIDYQAAGVDPWSTGWCQKMPTLVHLVKRVTESDNITVAGRPPAEYITEYEYRDPLYEGRQREFRGFERARARRIGDANSPTDISESVFMLGECVDETPDDGIEGCAPWSDNVREALKGLPLVSEKYDESGAYLSSAFNAYKLRTLYEGRDGRLVRHAFLSQTDAVAYDTGPFTPGSANVDIGALEVEDFPSEAEHGTFTTAAIRSANYAQIRSTNVVDGFGNQTLSVAHGCVAGNGCPPTSEPDFGPVEKIQSHTTAARRDDAVTGWLWRTVESWVDVQVDSNMPNPHATPRNKSRTEYDERGRATQQYITVYDVGDLDRFHDMAGREVAPLPANVQVEGVEYSVSQVEYDAFGNATQTTVPDFGRCARVSYDLDAYRQLPTEESIFLGPGCTGDPLRTGAAYDRGLGVVTTAVDFNLQPTQAVYDSFGRVTALYQPDLSNPGHASTTASVLVAYFLPTDLGGGARHSIIHTQTLTQDGIPDEASPAYLESYAYMDGFGRNIMALAEADPSPVAEGGDGAEWIVGNLLEYDNKSAVRRKYLEFSWNGDPLAYPFESAPTTLYGRQRYDAFGRQVQTFDLDGTVTLQSVYHALGTDLWDAADLENGPHHNSYASEIKDGHGRTVQTTERFRENGTMEQRHVRTRYLPTGEPELITRVRDDSPSVTRWMQYDSHGRMVVNVEPNTTDNYVVWGADLRTNLGVTKPWRYAYNALGELLGTSDARGCGQNFHYDQVGRLIAEDYSPCAESQALYTPITDLSSPDAATGAEVYYLYDAQTSSSAMPAGCGSNYLRGRTVAIFDRASARKSVYDARGRVTKSCLRVANPDGTNGPIASRYALRTYKKSVTYDSADREIAATTGLESNPTLDEALLGSDAQSRVTTQYTARGTVKSVGGSYGDLVTNIQRTADGLMQQMTYGDAAGTTTAYSYDQRRRLSSVQTYRGPPASGIWDSLRPDTNDPTSFQLLLQDEDFLYDIVGNPVEIHDWRDPAEWPAGAKPVTKKIQYDDLYRATRVDYQYSGGDDTWTSPFAYENSGKSDSRRATPAPHQRFDKRILQQTFKYDWLGNSDHTDDDAHGFYDRSLGTLINGRENGSNKPYQLQGAAHTVGTHRGNLAAEYDAAGNLTQLRVTREGDCIPLEKCNQIFDYQWDEVGRLAWARRWDVSDATGTSTPSGTPDADLRYYYDASDQRVIKRASVIQDDVQDDRYTVYLFNALELRGAAFGLTGIDDYEYTEDTVVPYLLANGVRLARVMWEINPVPSVEGVDVHVFFELGDHLGSTSVVLDQETGELVERSTFQAFGGAESDYRPERWAGFREDYRFTGKEEDVEVGLQYFGKRFLNPLLGRWVSADPLAVHTLGADLNAYAYVSGALLKNVDPVGLDVDPMHSVVQQNYESAKADRATAVAAQAAEKGAAQAEYITTIGKGDKAAMEAADQRLRAVEEKIHVSDVAWQKQEAKFQEALELTKDVSFADGTISSLRLYGGQHQIKRIDAAVDAVKRAGVFAVVGALEEAILPPATQSEREKRWAGWGVAGQTFEMIGRVQQGRNDVKDCAQYANAVGNADALNAVTNKAAGAPSALEPKVSVSPAPIPVGPYKPSSSLGPGNVDYETLRYIDSQWEPKPYAPVVGPPMRGAWFLGHE